MSLAVKLVYTSLNIEQMKCDHRKMWYDVAMRNNWASVSREDQADCLQAIICDIWRWERQLKRDTAGIGGVTRTLIDRHSGQGTIFGVFKLEFDSYESSRNLDTGVLHRISSRIYLAEWFGMGGHFGKHACSAFISKNKMSILFGSKSKNGFGPKCSPKSIYQRGVSGVEPPRQPNLLYESRH